MSLVDLVDEGFAQTPGELVDLLTDRGDAVGVDADGRLCVVEPVAARLRVERAEFERLAAEEAARAEAERAAAAAVLAAKQQAEAERFARDQAIRRRITKLQEVTGVSYQMLENELRRSYTHAPGTGMSLDARQAWREVDFSIDEVEQFVRERYGDHILVEEATK